MTYYCGYWPKFDKTKHNFAIKGEWKYGLNGYGGREFEVDFINEKRCMTVNGYIEKKKDKLTGKMSKTIKPIVQTARSQKLYLYLSKGKIY